MDLILLLNTLFINNFKSGIVQNLQCTIQFQKISTLESRRTGCCRICTSILLQKERIALKNLCKTATLRKTKNGFQDRLSRNEDQTYAECSTGSIKLPVFIKTFVLSIFEWPFYTGSTVCTRWKKSYPHPTRTNISR